MWGWWRWWWLVWRRKPEAVCGCDRRVALTFWLKGLDSCERRAWLCNNVKYRDVWRDTRCRVSLFMFSTCICLCPDVFWGPVWVLLWAFLLFIGSQLVEQSFWPHFLLLLAETFGPPGSRETTSAGRASRYCSLSLYYYFFKYFSNLFFFSGQSLS